MDRLTQIHQLLDHLSHLYFDTIGVLQRDAPPLYEEGSAEYTEEHAAKVAAFQAQIAERAKSVVEAHRNLEELINSLPSGEDFTPEAQQARLETLNEQDAALNAQLKESIAQADTWLEVVQEKMHAVSSLHTHTNTKHGGT